MVSVLTPRNVKTSLHFMNQRKVLNSPQLVQTSGYLLVCITSEDAYFTITDSFLWKKLVGLLNFLGSLLNYSNKLGNKSSVFVPIHSWIF